MNCKDCRHWSSERPDSIYKYEGPNRRCLKVVDAGNMPAPEISKLPRDVAFVCVYEAYENDLLTGPDFGCIHFEGKE